MARIRSIKPEFFIDEDLQDLEADNPGAYCMLVFAGLWGHCSREGVFEYKPRVLKLSILPFLDYSMADTLALLEGAGFIRRFSVDGKEYGFIPSFEKHQRISGKEAQFSPKYPSPKEGSTGEAPGKQPGIGEEAQEGEGEKEREKEETTAVGGGSEEPSRACDPPPETPVGKEEQIEGEVERVRALHLRTCGLNTLPPLAIVRAILESGQPPSVIDDVYQAHGGDIPKYRQRNIVERLTAIRDGKEARASPAVRGRKGRLSPSEARMQATLEAARAFAGGGDD